MTPITCPICQRQTAEQFPKTDDDSKIQCQVCGIYRISGTLRSILETASQHDLLRPYLSAHTRQSTLPDAAESGRPGSSAFLDENNFETLARSHMNVPVLRKLTRLLELLGAGSSHPGADVIFKPDFDYPLLDAAGQVEADYLLQHLIDARLITGIAGAYVFALTVRGWEQLRPTDSGGVLGTCFVAMSFARELDSAFDQGFRPAIEDDCGFKVVRTDRVHHNDNINDKIIADLRAAQFVVADFTLQRQSVYFEAGYALGLGRTVVWTCRDTDFDELHFDTRPYNHIKWTAPADLRNQLTARIRGTIPNTPKKL